MNSLLKKAAEFLLNHRRRKRWFQIVTSLAMVVVFVTTYLLILPAITIERTPVCGIEEHSHTKTCYVEMDKFVCGLEDDADHKHDNGCYDSVEVLICDLEEHIHDDTCFETEEDEENFRDDWDSDDLVPDYEDEMHEDIDTEFDSDIDFSKDKNNSHSGIEETAEPDADTENDVEPDGDSDRNPGDEIIVVITPEPAAGGNNIDEDDEKPSQEVTPEFEESEEPETSEETMFPLVMTFPPIATAPPRNTNIMYCGLPAHRHSDICYNFDGDLICELAEHEHSSLCYILDQPVMPMAATTLSGTVNGNLRWDFSLSANGSYTLTLSSADNSPATIPSNLFNQDRKLFECSQSVSKVYISKMITGIEQNAFAGIETIDYVEFEQGSKLTYICDGAFAHCKSLKSINLENCLELAYIGTADSETSSEDSGAFVKTALTTITIPSSVIRIGRFSFKNCDSLVNVHFEENDKLNYIGYNAFSECDELETINLEALNAEDIAFEFNTLMVGSAFDRNPSLKSVTVPGGAYYYYSENPNNYAYGLGAMFEFCTSLETITFEENYHEFWAPGTSMTARSMYRMVTETSVEVLDLTPLRGLVSIGYYAFERVNNLRTVIIPNTTTAIRVFAFGECQNLTSVQFEKGSHLNTIESRAFADNVNLREIDLSGLDELKSIQNEAFDNDSNLDKIELPRQFVKIGDNAFRNCTSLTEVIYNTICMTAAGGDGIASNAFDGASQFKLTIGERITDGVIMYQENLLPLMQHCKFLSFAPDLQFNINNDTGDTNPTTLPAPFKESGKYVTDSEGNLYKYYEDKNELKLVYANRENNVVTIGTPAGMTAAVTEIDTGAFDGCAAETVIISGDTTGITLNGYAFANAKNLSNINGKTNVSEAETLFAPPVPNTAFVNTALGDAPKNKDFNENAKEITDGRIELNNPQNGTPYMWITRGDDSRIKDDDESGNNGKYYTGNSAVIEIAVSNQNDEVDPVYRVYIQLEDSNFEMDIGSIGEYSFKLNRVGESNVYYYDLPAYVTGGTYNTKINISYPNFHAPGDVQVWSVRFDSEAAAEAYAGKLIEPAEAIDNAMVSTEYLNLEWITKRQEFELKKSHANAQDVSYIRTSDGLNAINGLQYNIALIGEGENVMDVGKDVVRFVDFADTINLPEGLTWREGLLSGSFHCRIINNGATLYVKIDGRDYILCQFANFGTISKVTAEPSGDGNLTISWRVINTSTEHEIDAIGSNALLVFGSNVIIANNEFIATNDHEVINTVTSDIEYTFSSPRHRSAAVNHYMTAGEGSVSFAKEMSDMPKNMGETAQYRLVVENQTAYDYHGLKTVTDTLSKAGNSLQYMTAKDMQEILFDDENSDGQYLAIAITNATLTQPLSGTATAIDGEEKVKLSPQNTSTEPQYNGLASVDNTLKTNNATLTLERSDDKILLRVSYNNINEEILIGPGGEFTDVQSALDSLAYIVTAIDNYVLTWTYPADYVLSAGTRKEYVINSTLKTSLMYLPQTINSNDPRGDQNFYYQYATPPGSVKVELWNDARLTSANPDDDIIVSAPDEHLGIGLDYEIYKWATINGVRVDGDINIEDGDILDYTVNVNHHGTGSLETLPVVDHLSGRQAVLALVSENENASWTDRAELYTAKGKQYYILNQEYKYEGVYLNGIYAESVTVTKGKDGAEGLDSIIKYYLKDTLPTDYVFNFTYSAICSVEYAYGDTTANNYRLDNEAWLNDYPTHRIYAPFTGGAAFLGFEKKILEERASLPDFDLLDADDTLAINYNNRTVTYRLMLYNRYDDDTYVTGNQMYDMLPETGTAFDWTKNNISIEYAASDGVTMTYNGISTRVFAEKDRVKSTGAEWNLVDENPEDTNILPKEGQRYIVWNDDFELTFPSYGKFYMYVTLEFTSTEEEWDEYIKEKGPERLSNTYYLFGMPDTVTHYLVDPGKVLLQKGVYEIGHYMTNDNGDLINTYYMDADRYHYADTAANEGSYSVKNVVTYYVIIRNSGNTPFYLEPLYDVLPEGFKYMRLISAATDVGSTGTSNRAPTHNGGYDYNMDAMLARTDFVGVGQTSQHYKAAKINYSSAGETADGRQILRFEVDKWDGASWDPAIDYDELGCYLKPNTFTTFGYTCYTGDAEIPKATNSIVMEYNRELNGSEVTADNDSIVTVTDVNGKNNNDGSREVWDNREAAAAGYGSIETAGENPQWLASSVDVIRGSVIPGITKTVDNPMVNIDSPGVNWTVTSHNNGTAPMVGYTIEDIVDAPLRIRGDVTYSLWNNNSSKADNHYMYMSAGKEAYYSGRNEPVTDGTDGRGLLVRIDDVEGSDDKVKLSYFKADRNMTSQTVSYGEPLTIPGLNYTYSTVWYQDYPAGYSHLDEVTICLSRDEETGSETLRLDFSDDWVITENSYSLLSIPTTANKDDIEQGMYVNNAKLMPNDMNYDGEEVTQGCNIVVNGENAGTENSAPVTVYQGSPSESFKEIEEVDNPENHGWSYDTKHNNITLEDATKEFTYTLTVLNKNNTGMQKLVLIDNLPYVGDGSPVRDGLKRNTEFNVGFSNNPNIIVETGKIPENKDEDTVVIAYTTVASDKYTIEYSTKDCNFQQKGDWDGTNPGDWQATSNNVPPANARSIRMVIDDPDIVKENTAIRLKFNAKIDDPNAMPGQIAWNSFGYEYQMVGSELINIAAPLNVGVRIPAKPYIEKRVVNGNGVESPVKETETFRFVIYTGSSLNINDYSEASVGELLTNNGRSFAYVDLAVNKNESVSERKMLNELYKASFSNGKFETTSELWKWNEGEEYNIVEINPVNNYYSYSSTNGMPGQQNYSFKYSYEKNVALKFDNKKIDWQTIIKKVNETDNVLQGALFGIYSPNKYDAMTKNEFELLGIDAQFAERVKDGVTYYLMGVSTSGADGLIRWSGLTEDSYLVYEIKAPDGYYAEEDARQILVTRDMAESSESLSADLKVINRSFDHIPETGGSGSKELLKILGILSYICCAAYCGFRFVRKHV